MSILGEIKMIRRCPYCGVLLNEIFVVSMAFSRYLPAKDERGDTKYVLSNEGDGDYTIECTNGCNIREYADVDDETIVLDRDMPEEEKGENIHLDEEK
jgi:hypothetical protein